MWWPFLWRTSGVLRSVWRCRVRVAPRRHPGSSPERAPASRPGVTSARCARTSDHDAVICLQLLFSCTPGCRAGSTAGDARAQPWRCLWRGLSQITMTRPWRRITLHLSQIFLTLGLTFISSFLRRRAGGETLLLVAVDDPAAGQVVRAELDDDAVLREDPDVVLAHLARDVGEHLVAVGQLDPEHRVRESLDHRALDLDDTVLLRHILR